MSNEPRISRKNDNLPQKKSYSYEPSISTNNNYSTQEITYNKGNRNSSSGLISLIISCIIILGIVYFVGNRFIGNLENKVHDASLKQQQLADKKEQLIQSIKQNGSSVDKSYVADNNITVISKKKQYEKTGVGQLYTFKEYGFRDGYVLATEITSDVIKYANVVSFYHSSSNVEFYIGDRDFDYLEFTVFISESIKYGHNPVIKVYFDDKLVYSTKTSFGTITDKTKAKYVKINIPVGTEFVKITSDDNTYSGSSFVKLGNVYFVRQQ